jgi:hypothetical protein
VRGFWYRNRGDGLDDGREGLQRAPSVSRTAEPQTVEGDEARLTAAIGERVEEGVVIETHDLAVEDRVPNASERDGDLISEQREALEGVAVAGDEAASTALDVGERTEAVELQLV